MECPCKDCITFAICKNIQKQKENTKIISSDLLAKCSLIRDYTGYDPNKKKSYLLDYHYYITAKRKLEKIAKVLEMVKRSY